ncbi:hypothetical protein RhiirC2_758576 [Rhizophagus irregularis]|uniref:Uncharacterized protein n=1 Tax=Rhizophagus irregularis TaxID=588596 RepID=A0A2N1MNK8_9GLOM|nr:hypothetical protein RhiirC2_758576 [Rhizophagus irregularis]
MSSLLGLAVRFSRPVPHIFRPTVFFSSTARLFNKSLMMRNLVQEMLKDKGLPIINTTSSFFTREDVEALKVSFQPVTSSSLIISPDDGKYLCYFSLSDPVTLVDDLLRIVGLNTFPLVIR